MSIVMTFAVTSAIAAPPQLYDRAGYQSPVTGDADDLLLLPGFGLAAGQTVVYKAVAAGARAASPPSSLPTTASASEGIAQVVSVASAPHALTVVLPEMLDKRQRYDVWVRDEEGRYSNAIRINDPRPLWFTPAYAYTSGSVASLPRELKIVGRNLRPRPGSSMQVRLSGQQRLVLQTLPATDTGRIDDYALRAALPEGIAAGRYTVAVGTDGADWITVDDQVLDITAPPSRAAKASVAAHGGCRPDDDLDDTGCVIDAIKAVAAAGGGSVTFDAGTWLLKRLPTGAAARTGIVVPEGVDLRGQGSAKTILLRGAEWLHRDGAATFTLRGKNRLDGFTFADARIYRANDPFNPMLRLGDGTRPVADVAITRNRFDKPHVAIQDSGVAIRHLFIVRNEFGAYREAIRLDGNRYDLDTSFRVDDSVINFNTFRPGSYIDVAITQGAIATEIGASTRLDFSRNVADGSSSEFLYSAGDARGWRAAYFWHLNNNHERMLVAQNAATCTGDKAGDGEAFAYDNNGNTFAFDRARSVSSATPSSISAAGPLLSQQNGKELRRPDFYVGHWVQIVEGPGLGQVRKIVSYRHDTQGVTFDVAPAWDVVPRAELTRFLIGREFWQVYTIDNDIDNRAPLCLKSNRNRPKAGAITMWAHSSDSVVAGNTLYDSDGISFQQTYASDTPGAALQSFLEIRDNLIDGEYDWRSDCSHSGIMASNSAAPSPSAPPPVLGYGVVIARNTIRRADGLRGGAITIPLTWHQGPRPNRWNAIDTLLIHHNTLSDLNGPPPTTRCDHRQSQRIGINLSQAQMVRGVVLYANECRAVTKGLNDDARETVRVCRQPRANSCECTNR